MTDNNFLKHIEELEKKYLRKYYYFLKFVEDDIIKGLKTKNDIKNDWFEKWNTADNEKKISDFNTGAERVIYSLINSKGIGIPNSCPVGSDLMFEVEDAYIHIDLKTVQTSNINDFKNSIFVGNNQISYNSNYIVNNQERVFNSANLPTFYNKNNSEKKYCLTYFLSILHDEKTFETICIYITCFPNGLLKPLYKGDVFKAGKNPDKVRFNFRDCLNFKLADGNRTLVIHLNQNVDQMHQKDLQFFAELEKNQRI